MSKKLQLIHKLKVYSALAAGLVASGKPAKAAIVYTDINPDAIKGTNSNYGIDLNNDASIDLDIYHQVDLYMSGRLFASGPSTTRFARVPANGTSSIAKLDFGTMIDGTHGFTTSATGYFGATPNANPTIYAWMGGATDKYVGVKFQIGANVHYGWVLLDVGTDLRSYKVKSFAYENTPNAGIQAGDVGTIVPAPIATSLTATDLQDNNNASDIQISWTRPADEAGIAKYRVFIVPAAQAGSFDLPAASAMEAGRYYEVTPNGTHPSVTLPSTILGTDGKVISNGNEYSLYVMSVAGTGYSNNLSLASNKITITGLAKAIQNPAIIDNGEANNASSILLSFNKASDETGIAKYRIFVVPETAGVLQLNAAVNITAGRYLDIIPSGSNMSLNLTADILATDGSTISNGKTYNIYVLSLAGAGYRNNLSVSSNALTLQGSTAPVTSLLAMDQADNNNASDLKIGFTKADNESGIDHYRAFVVPLGAAGIFDLSKALAISSTSYFSIALQGKDISVDLPAALLGTDGNTITIGKEYKVFVLSVGKAGYTSSLSGGSNSIILKVPATSVSQLIVKDTADNNNGSDIHVSFNKIQQGLGVAKYRFIVVPGENDLNLTTALQALPENYHETTVTGATGAMTLPNHLKTVEGTPITSGKPYKIYVLSIGNTGYSDVLSMPSNTFSLTTRLDTIGMITVYDDADNGNTSDIKISFTKAQVELGIFQYRVFVVPAHAAKTFHLSVAQQISSGRFYDILPDGNDVSVHLPVPLLSTDGNAIAEGKEYKIFVQSVSNMTGYADQLSGGSSVFTLSKITGIGKDAIGKLKIERKENELHIGGILEGAKLSVYNVAGIKIGEMDLHPGDNLMSLPNPSEVLIVHIATGNKREIRKLID